MMEARRFITEPTRGFKLAVKRQSVRFEYIQI